MESSNTENTGPPTVISCTPWVEKYRPKNLSEVAHQTEIVSTLTNAIETNRLPHLLFYGPPGTGKTSVALALCRQLWHPSQYRDRVLELNASDERGISVVREKIKRFAGRSVGASNDDGRYPNPPFKIIVLDEADAVTPDAQAALRRVIEAYSRVTRFVLICNYVTRIIPPLCSRCAKFRFAPLPPDAMRARLEGIAAAEECRLEDDRVLSEILDAARGDMRRAVTVLQCARALGSGAVRRVDVAEIAGRPTPSATRRLLRGLSDGSFSAAENAVRDVVDEGWPAPTILSCLLETLVLRTDAAVVDADDENAVPVLAEEDVAALAIKMAEADKRLVDGADEFLQLMSVCSMASKCLARAKTAKLRS